MGRLDGKRALVSGTGGGIGRATALLLAREGAHVVGGDLNEQTSAETAALARAAGGRMDAVGPAWPPRRGPGTGWTRPRTSRAGSTSCSTTRRRSGSGPSTSSPLPTGP